MFLHTETQRWKLRGPWVSICSGISAANMEAFTDVVSASVLYFSALK